MNGKEALTCRLSFQYIVFFNLFTLYKKKKKVMRWANMVESKSRGQLFGGKARAARSVEVVLNAVHWFERWYELI